MKKLILVLTILMLSLSVFAKDETTVSSSKTTTVTTNGLNGIMIPIIWIGDIDDDEEEE